MALAAAPAVAVPAEVASVVVRVAASAGPVAALVVLVVDPGLSGAGAASVA